MSLLSTSNKIWRSLNHIVWRMSKNNEMTSGILRLLTSYEYTYAKTQMYMHIRDCRIRSLCWKRASLFYLYISFFFFAFVWKICVCMFVDDNTKENGVEKFYIIKRVKENRARRVVVFIVQLEVWGNHKRQRRYFLPPYWLVDVVLSSLELYCITR